MLEVAFIGVSAMEIKATGNGEQGTVKACDGGLNPPSTLTTNRWGS
jgi:hypothetical protein